MRPVIIVLLLMLAVTAAAQSKRKILRHKPENLEEVLLQLHVFFNDSSKNYIMRVSETDFMCRCQFETAAYLTNKWQLTRRRPPIAKYFNAMGVYRSNDMIQIILRSYYRKMHGCEIDLDGQIQDLWDYYRQLEKRHQRAYTSPILEG